MEKVSESYESPTQLLQRKINKCQRQTKQKDWCKNTQIGSKGLAKWKGYRWTCIVNPNFTPIAQLPRRQPFSIREKMEKEIPHLLDQDIIEKVDEPTGWVFPPRSPVVTPKKNEDQIRLNVDMRAANQAIPRRNIQHPTIDDVINELNGATVFSHLDMCKRYHQLELRRSSRNVTTFSIRIGQYSETRTDTGPQGSLQHQRWHNRTWAKYPRTRRKPGSLHEEKPWEECHIHQR